MRQKRNYEALLTWPKWDAQLVLTMFVEILKSYRISHIATKLFAIAFCYHLGKPIYLGLPILRNDAIGQCTIEACDF